MYFIKYAKIQLTEMLNLLMLLIETIDMLQEDIKSDI